MVTFLIFLGLVLFVAGGFGLLGHYVFRDRRRVSTARRDNLPYPR